MYVLPNIKNIFKRKVLRFQETLPTKKYPENIMTPFSVELTLVDLIHRYIICFVMNIDI